MDTENPVTDVTNVTDIVDSVTAAEMLGITQVNLRQIVWRKIIVPVGKHKRKSLFNISDIERVKALRKPVVHSGE